MHWYVAKVVFKIVCGDGNHTPQFDEQLRLIQATDDDEAFAKAIKVGRHGQDTFLNKRNQLVQWQFINIPELHKLATLTDGMELYSRVQEVENAAAYINIINGKAEYLRSALHEQQPEIV